MQSVRKILQRAASTTGMCGVSAIEGVCEYFQRKLLNGEGGLILFWEKAEWEKFVDPPPPQ